MGKACNVCGGLIPASNEVLSYSGPICNGIHGGGQPTYVLGPNDNNSLREHILRLERRIDWLYLHIGDKKNAKEKEVKQL
jgi:hypothetical protein